MPLGLKIQFDNKEAIKKEYFNFIKELSDTKINLGVNFNINEINNIKSQINNIQNQLGSELKSSSSAIAKNVGVGQDEIVQKFKKTNEDIQNILGERKKSIEQLANQTAKIGFSTNDKGDITSAYVEYKDTLGRMQKDLYGWSSSLKTVKGQLVETFDFDVVGRKFANNIEVSTKALDKFESTLTNLKSQNETFSFYGGSDDFNKNYEQALKTINQLRDDSSKRTETQKNKIVELINSLENENSAISNLMKSEKERESVLREEQNIRSKLGKESNKRQEEAKDIDYVKNKYKDLMEIKLQNLQSKYGSLVDESSIKNVKKGLNDINGTTLKDVRREIEQVGIQFKQLEADVKSKSGIKGQTDIKSDMDYMLENFKKMAELKTMNFVMNEGFSQIREAVKYVKDMNTALTDLNKVVDLSSSQLNNMRLASVSLGNDLAKSSIDIAKSMSVFGAYTKDIGEIQELTRVATMASNVTDLSASESAKAITGAMVSFKMNAKDSMKILDSWNELQNNFLVRGEDLSSSIGKVGSIAKQTGTDINYLNAVTTTLVSSMNISGDEAGTAIKGVLSRLYNMGEEGDGGKAQKLLKSFGLEVVSTTGKLKPLNKVLEELDVVMKNATESQKLQIEQALGRCSAV